MEDHYVHIFDGLEYSARHFAITETFNFARDSRDSEKS